MQYCKCHTSLTLLLAPFIQVSFGVVPKARHPLDRRRNLAKDRDACIARQHTAFERSALRVNMKVDLVPLPTQTWLKSPREAPVWSRS